MDTLTITVKLDGAAILDGGEEEVYAIVARAAQKAMNTGIGPNGAVGPAFDSSGNTVGTWRVS